VHFLAVNKKLTNEFVGFLFTTIYLTFDSIQYSTTQFKEKLFGLNIPQTTLENEITVILQGKDWHNARQCKRINASATSTTHFYRDRQW
jgi:thiosulfate reductase cytochrome b subunit